MFSCGFYFSIRPNCSHQFETAPEILSWFTEWMIRNECSVFEASALKCMVSLSFFFLIRIPRLKAPILLNTGWPDLYLWIVPPFERLQSPISFRCVRKSSIPPLFVSRTEKRPVSLRESLRVFLDFWIRSTNTIVSFHCPIDVVEHCHEADPVCEFSRFDVAFSQIILDLLKNLQWRKSWENIPLEFKCFSIWWNVMTSCLNMPWIFFFSHRGACASVMTQWG